MVRVLSSGSLKLAFLLIHAVVFSFGSAQSKFVPTPPGAPPGRCEFTPSNDPASLRKIRGAAPLLQVVCGPQAENPCSGMEDTPGTRTLPANALVEFDHSLGDWACVELQGVPLWIKSSRLAPLPSVPQLSVHQWIGWYRQLREVPGKKNDRLLLSPGKDPGTIHISGRAYWYGLNDDVHSGEIDTEARLYGRYLHAVDGTGPGACLLDLFAMPGKGGFLAQDNSKCGGMNVRFGGEWKRFTPTAKR